MQTTFSDAGFLGALRVKVVHPRPPSETYRELALTSFSHLAGVPLTYPITLSGRQLIMTEIMFTGISPVLV